MPNRVIREGILDSDRMDKLSWPGECFYRRLHSIVDDYGCFDARPSILKSKLYPTEKKQAIVSLPDIEKWMLETVEAGLVRCYVVAEKPYLVVLDFNQQVRIKKRKFPEPPEECYTSAKHMHSTCMSETKPNQTETESETETNPGANAEDKKKVVKEKKEEPAVELPWQSEKFQSVWAVWKEYRWREKRQKFKSSASELAQLKHLHELANGKEEDAIAIIEQSIGNTWTGLFQLKNPTKKGNGSHPQIKHEHGKIEVGDLG